jgi:hypothetical protein
MAKDEALKRHKTDRARRDPLGANTAIARKLKEYYGGLVTDEVPDRFSDLLSRLEAAESPNKKTS